MLCSRTTASSGVTCTNRTVPAVSRYCRQQAVPHSITIFHRRFVFARCAVRSGAGPRSRSGRLGSRPSSVTADPPPRSVSRTRIVVRVETARAGPDESVHGICGRRQSLGGSITPSCTKKSRLSQKLRSSTTLPSSNRSMVTPGLSMVLPVASIPCSAPSCVPRPV